MMGEGSPRSKNAYFVSFSPSGGKVIGFSGLSSNIGFEEIKKFATSGRDMIGLPDLVRMFIKTARVIP
jgi:hypothetical protein